MLILSKVVLWLIWVNGGALFAPGVNRTYQHHIIYIVVFNKWNVVHLKCKEMGSRVHLSLCA